MAPETAIPHTEDNNPLHFVERRAYKAAVHRAIAGIEDARVALATAIQRIEEDTAKTQSIDDLPASVKKSRVSKPPPAGSTKVEGDRRSRKGKDMATNQMSGFIQHLRRVLRDGAGLTDGQLLADYLSRRDEAAIAALVRRHGPMVWGVCRRVLRNHHDAEDAFQTTFLVLVRKAASIASRELLANWLYGVAHQTALKARATAAKRKGRERQATEMPEPAVIQQDQWRDLQPLLDEELSRLPAKYRSVIVLCDLEGKTRKEAAVQLRCPEGTVAGRLARARIMLAKRLTRRGVALSGGAIAAALSQQAASAGVPTSVVISTIKAASLLAAGKAAATGAISVKVAALTEGVMKAMLFTKLKAVLAVVLVLGFVATGATILTSRTAAGQEDKPPVAEKPVKASPKQEEKKEGFTAWGKEVGDLQGEWVVAAMEGDGKKASADDLKGMKWVVEGNEITANNPDSATGKMSFKLDPGKRPKEIDITSLDGNLKGTTSSGIYAIEGRRLRVCFAEKGRPKEFATAPGDRLTMITLEKKDVTAWGKEIGGLQAGLGYLPDQPRTYHIGETVTLVVRVRNVSKEAVKFKYLRNFFMEKPPTVTDGEGKPVHFRYGVIDLSRVHPPVDVNLAPGKEIELYELSLELRPASQSGKALLSTLYGTGKFQVQYERVFGNSSAGKIALDSALSKLATGKLELEVKDAEKASPKQEEEKEGFTVWGNEAGGLQAGLGFRPGEHRAYHHGETVTLVVRVRNVGKEDVKFQYVPQFLMEKPPAVMDGEDKPVHLGGVTRLGFHIPVDVTLPPGKEFDLYELKLELGSGSETGIGVPKHPTLYGTGKFHIQYEQVLGNSSSGFIKLDPTLSKLATGKLELEIKPEAAPKDDNEANKTVNPRVSIDKTKATVEGQLDEASTLVLRIGEEKDKLFWEARRKDTPGSAMVRFSEEGAKRFWGDKAQSAGAFKAVVELSEKILMSDGKFATGFIYSVAISEGAATEKQSLIGSIIYVPIPKTGSLQDFLARSLEGDAMPFGQLSLREESKVVRKDGVVTFADIQKGDGKLVPVSFVMEKSHSSLKKEATVTK